MPTALWQSLARFDASKIAPDLAIRNAIGIVLPLVVGAAMGNASAGVVASLGALNVSYSDSRDPYMQRARRMLLASGLVGIAVTAGALSAPTNITAVLSATIWAFAVGMMVVLGNRAGDLGSVTLVTLIVFAARSLTIMEAFESGLLAFSGGLLQTLLSIAVWPVRPHAPESRIIEALYESLARIATSPAGSAGAPPATTPIIDAQQALSALADDRSREGERLTFLLNQAERIRLSLLTIRRLAQRLRRDPAGREPVEELNHLLRNAEAALLSISQRIKAPSLQIFEAAARTFRECDWPTPSGMFAATIRDAKAQVDALAGQIRAAAGLTTTEPPPRNAAKKPHDLFARRARIYANLSFRSTAFRHAIRLAVCVGLGDAIGRSLSLQRTYWLPMTIAIVLKPDYTATFTRGILRIAGTFAGLLLATALFHILPQSVFTDIILITAFALILRWVGPANYGIFVAAISAIVVLFIAITGVDPREAIVARAINTALGGGIALIVYRIWPTWERTQTGPVLAELLDLYRAYFHALSTDPASSDAIRLSARLARSNAEASAGRFNAEPGVTPEQRNLLNEILVSSHAFARALMALESDPAQKKIGPSFASSIEATLTALAQALRDGDRIPDGVPDLRAAWTAMQESTSPEDRYSLWLTETDRMTTGLNTLREQIAKWNKR
jgi:uncharacterized membrane protein YccC